jgi:hypothetical protein
MKKIEPANLGVYVCPHIFEDTRPILYVCRAGGDWQFLCGNDDHDENPHLVGVGHLTERDPTLNELADLKEDWEAERKEIGAEWVYSECEPE